MSYRLRFHPLVEQDLEDIVRWISDQAGTAAATQGLDEIEETILGLSRMPHKGSIRSEIAPGLRAIPGGRRAVIAFTIDDAAREVLTQAVSYGGANWVRRSRARGR